MFESLSYFRASADRQKKIMGPTAIPRPLTSFSVGSVVRLEFFSLSAVEEQRLRDLGIREGNELQILKNEDSFVLRVEASRIVLRKEVAMAVFATLESK
jgi:Fe2+ transport system protein FeoA